MRARPTRLATSEVMKMVFPDRDSPGDPRGGSPASKERLRDGRRAPPRRRRVSPSAIVSEDHVPAPSAVGGKIGGGAGGCPVGGGGGGCLAPRLPAASPPEDTWRADEEAGAGTIDGAARGALYGRGMHRYALKIEYDGRAVFGLAATEAPAERAGRGGGGALAALGGAAGDRGGGTDRQRRACPPTRWRCCEMPARMGSRSG